jgi:hypothetical protein
MADPTPAEAYIAYYFNARKALNKAHERLSDMAMDELSVALQADAAAKALDTERRLELMKAEHDAFLLGPGPVAPPPADAMAAAVALSVALAADLARAMKADAIFASATSVADGLSQFHRGAGPGTGPGSGPGAGPGGAGGSGPGGSPAGGAGGASAWLAGQAARPA